jgi:transcriptional regulator with XRE-family HTH domain
LTYLPFGANSNLARGQYIALVIVELPYVIIGDKDKVTVNLPSQNPKDIGARLSKVRKERRLLQAEVAESLGISASQYSKSEIGARKLGSAAIRSFCSIYGVREDWLLTGNGDAHTRSSPPPAALVVEESTEAYRVAPGNLRDAIRIIAVQMDVTEERAAGVLGRVIAELGKEEC